MDFVLGSYLTTMVFAELRVPKSIQIFFIKMFAKPCLSFQICVIEVLHLKWEALLYIYSLFYFTQ